MNDYFAHETALIDKGAEIGTNTKIWSFTHIMSKARIGKDCNIGQGVFIENGAIVGNSCKIQNNVNIYEGVHLEDFVFCGPSMTFTNVKTPRCKFPRERGSADYLETTVKEGASLGAQSVVVCGVNIGKAALIGSGAVVTSDVLDYAIVVGNPAKQIGWICECGNRLSEAKDYICDVCGRKYEVSDGIMEQI